MSQWRHFGGGQVGNLPLSDFKSGRCPVVAVLPLLYFISTKTCPFDNIFRKYAMY